MKKVLLTVACLISAIFAFAQKQNMYPQKGLHVGFSGEFNTVWIVNQNSYKQDEYQYRLKLGGNGGLDIGYNITNHIGIQTGISFSSQGQKYEDSHHNTGLKRDYSLKYTCIPVLFKYIGGSSSVKFYGQVGPRFSFLSSALISSNDPNFLSGNAKTKFSSSDVGLLFGLGTIIGVTKNIYINAGMNFFYSFGDINSAKVTNEAGTVTSAYASPDSPQGTWRWKDQHGSGIYKASHNGTGGVNVGVHYLIPSK